MDAEEQLERAMDRLDAKYNDALIEVRELKREVARLESELGAKMVSDIVRVHARCDECKKYTVIEMPRAAWLEHKSGKLIQDALPMLTAAHRELLVSGTCNRCFSAAFGLGS